VDRRKRLIERWKSLLYNGRVQAARERKGGIEVIQFFEFQVVVASWNWVINRYFPHTHQSIYSILSIGFEGRPKNDLL